MPAHKGHKKIGGRTKGTPNKITVDLKETWFWVFNELGGRDGWLAHVKKNALHMAQFYKTGEKMIPASVEVAGKDGGPIQHQIFKAEYADDDPGR
jgi:hypothetical protein